MLCMTQDARELYEARNYAGVVTLLADTPREMLVARPEQGFMLADAARRVGGVPDVVSLIDEVVEAARSQGETTVLCNALNLQGVLLLEAGRAHAAERAWCDLVIIATEADSRTIAAVTNKAAPICVMPTIRASAPRHDSAGAP